MTFGARHRTAPGPDSLDPRRVPRGASARRPDWASATLAVGALRVRELIATVLVRVGGVRW